MKWPIALPAVLLIGLVVGCSGPGLVVRDPGRHPGPDDCLAAKGERPSPESQLDKAKLMISRTQLIGGDSDDGHLALARLSERRGRLKQAEQLYLSLIEKQPDDPVAYHRLGVLAARQRKFPQAERYFLRALELATPTADLLNDVGYALYLQNRLVEAEKVLRQALEEDFDHGAVCNNLGLVLGELGRMEESLAAFRRAAPDGQAYANMAYVYSQLGDYDQAIAYYSRALTMDQGLRPAALAMLQLDRRQKRLSPQRSEPTAVARSSPRATKGTPRSSASLLVDPPPKEPKDQLTPGPTAAKVALAAYFGTGKSSSELTPAVAKEKPALSRSQADDFPPLPPPIVVSHPSRAVKKPQVANDRGGRSRPPEQSAGVASLRTRRPAQNVASQAPKRKNTNQPQTTRPMPAQRGAEPIGFESQDVRLFYLNHGEFVEDN